MLGRSAQGHSFQTEIVVKGTVLTTIGIGRLRRCNPGELSNFEQSHPRSNGKLWRVNTAR
jgi:hypothetical protein